MPGPARFRPVRVPLAAALLLAACSGGGGAPAADGPHPLADLDTARITVGGVPFEVWLARTAAEKRQGLMGITDAQIAPLPDGTERGMLFLYDSDLLLGFWMEDTLIPLDLAYARADGTIAEVHALRPLDPTIVRAGEPVRYALELPAGTLAAHGLGPGDGISLPAGIAAAPAPAR